MGSVAQAMHGAAKGMDEAVELGGGLGPLGAMTKSLVGLTEGLVASTEQSAGGAVASATESKIHGSHTHESKHASTEVAATPKLGRNAHHFNGIVTSPLAMDDPHFADFNHIQVPNVQNILGPQVSTGVNVT
jgi:hypothetical protein